MLVAAAEGSGRLLVLESGARGEDAGGQDRLGGRVPAFGESGKRGLRQRRMLGRRFRAVDGVVEVADAV